MKPRVQWMLDLLVSYMYDTTDIQAKIILN